MSTDLVSMVIFSSFAEARCLSMVGTTPQASNGTYSFSAPEHGVLACYSFHPSTIIRAKGIYARPSCVLGVSSAAAGTTPIPSTASWDPPTVIRPKTTRVSTSLTHPTPFLQVLGRLFSLAFLLSLDKKRTPIYTLSSSLLLNPDSRLPGLLTVVSPPSTT